jgi:hypothetical protein
MVEISAKATQNISLQTLAMGSEPEQSFSFEINSENIHRGFTMMVSKRFQL